MSQNGHRGSEISFVLSENRAKDIFLLLPSLGLHSHCANCFKSARKCSGDQDSCNFVECSCGSSFHRCKLLLHLDCCPNEQVPCLNKEFGCDREMPRSKQSSHLPLCPANVIMCKAEWNRWPIYSMERRTHIPFRQRNPLAVQGQLDYDLTLRDQRMLDSLKKLPRRTKLCLRNYLTRRYPAVPIPASALRYGNAEAHPDPDVPLNEDDCIDAGDDTTYIGARKKKMYDEQIKRWQNDLNVRLKGKEIPPKYWEFPELEKGGIHKHCSYCYDIHCKRSEQTTFTTYEDMCCDIVNCREGCGARYHNCKSSEHMIICPEYVEQDEYEWMLVGIRRTANRKGQTKIKRQKQNQEQYRSLERTWPEPTPSAKTPRKITKPRPPPMPSNLHLQSPLDIRLDTVTRLQAKPRSMYTFVCAQEFKRCEYSTHYQNIHSEIHGGLNNWIEHRCPLSGYGCGFSARKLFPHSEKFTVVYSAAVESFGVTSVSAPVKKKSSPNKLVSPTKKKSKPIGVVKSVASTKDKTVSIEDLPMEILEKIFLMMDSFSLCNLSLTCIYFRDICRSMLDTSGCVSLQWERVKVGAKKFRWQVAYKRWFFSTAIDPIERWSFTNREGAVSEHLKTCPYNIRVEHKPHPKSDPKWKEVLEALDVKLSYKRNSEWFIQ